VPRSFRLKEVTTGGGGRWESNETEMMNSNRN
jgi:hypothetical protein